MNENPLKIERTYNAPIERVWQALTDLEQMRQWYFNLADFKPVVGFEFQFDAGDKDVTYTHLCKITEVIPGKKIAYSWFYKGYEGNSVVSFELFDEGGKTRLELLHKGLDSFPKLPAFATESFNKGWTHFSGTLGNFVEKKEA